MMQIIEIYEEVWNRHAKDPKTCIALSKNEKNIVWLGKRVLLIYYVVVTMFEWRNIC